MGLRLNRAERGTISLFVGSLGGAVLGFLGTVAIGKLYDPVEVGFYSSMVCVATMLVPLVTLRNEAAIIPAGSDAQARAYARTAIKNAYLTCGLICIPAALLTLFLPGDQKSKGFGVLLTCIMTLLYAIFAVLTQVAARHHFYAKMANRSSIQNATIVAAQSSTGIFWPSFGSLAAGEILGRGMGLLLLWTKIRHLMLPGMRCSYRRTLSREAVVYSLPASLLDTASSAVIVPMITMWYGPIVSGNLSLAQRVLLLPVSLIGSALGPVLLAEYASSYRLGRDPNISRPRHLLAWLVCGGSLFAIGFVVFGPQLIAFISSEEWQQAGSLVRLLGPFLVISLVWNPLSSLFLAVGGWKEFLVLSALRLGGVIVVGAVLHAVTKSATWTVLGMYGATAAVQGIGLIKLKKLVANVGR